MFFRVASLWFSAYLGWHSFDDDNRLGAVTDFQSGEHHAPDDGPAFGVRVAHPLGCADRFAVELDVSVVMADDQIDGGDAFPVLGFALSGVADLTRDDQTGGRLYAIAGAGVRRSLGGDVPVADTELTLRAGIGARVRLGEHWGLRLQGLALTSDFSATDYEVTAGGYWTLGR